VAVTIVKELADSRRFKISLEECEGEAKWIALRSDDPGEIYDAVLAVAPATLEGLTLKDLALDPQGGGVWFVTAMYGIEHQSAISPQYSGGGEPAARPPALAPGPAAGVRRPRA
jgi:hypothetical protein